MYRSTKLLLASLAVVAFTASAAASAHSTGQSGTAMPGQGMTGGGMMGQGMMGSGTMHGGAMTGGMNLHQGQGAAAMPMQRHQGHQGHMGAGQGYMHQGGQAAGGMMGSHHMGRGMMGHGLRVRPIQHLSVDDVTHFFGHFLQRRGNKRLKLGEVTKKDEDTITVQIVTVDGSLVQTFEVDRHSGVAKRTE